MSEPTPVYTTVLLRCPAPLYAWFEEQHPRGSVEQAMLAVLTDWQEIATSVKGHTAENYRRLAHELGVMPAASVPQAPPAPPPPPPPVRQRARQRRASRRRERAGQAVQR